MNLCLIFPGGELYSGTVADFSGSDALVIRDNVRTEQYDLKHLNGERKQSHPTEETEMMRSN